jgi:uncharacterized protein (TIGR01244 family)
VSLRIVSVGLISVCVCSSPVLGQQVKVENAVEIGLDPATMPHEVSGFAGEIRGLWRDGRVFIAGQPDEVAFDRFQKVGVTAVVNLRTPAEMSDRERVPFDEAAVVEALGMEYVHIPLGGDDHPYTPAAVDRFAEVLERHDGLVLLHCTVAWRASYMWAAYLVREQGFSLAAAMARGEAMAIGDLPIEGLLGRQLELVYAD